MIGYNSIEIWLWWFPRGQGSLSWYRYNDSSRSHVFSAVTHFFGQKMAQNSMRNWIWDTERRIWRSFRIFDWKSEPIQEISMWSRFQVILRGAISKSNAYALSANSKRYKFFRAIPSKSVWKISKSISRDYNGSRWT